LRDAYKLAGVGASVCRPDSHSVSLGYHILDGTTSGIATINWLPSCTTCSKGTL
jgi:hypothetical protein